MGVADQTEHTADPVCGVPVDTQQQPMQTVMVRVEDPAGPKEHFAMGCLASGFCGCCGLLGQRVFLQTPRGNYGGCTGCVANTVLGVVVLLIVLILEQSLDYIKFETEFLHHDDCIQLHGQWGSEGCYLSECPPGFVEEGVRSDVHGVETCSMRHIMLMLRLAQLAGSCCVLAIAGHFLMRYRREVHAAEGRGFQQLPQHTVLHDVQVN